MDRRAGIAGMLIALGLFLAYLLIFERPKFELPKFQLEPAPAQKDVPRIGVNLGAWNSWGAQQYFENALMNPGFEGVIDRDVVKVKSAQGDEVLLDKELDIEGFWNGAVLERLNGENEEWKGVVKEQKGGHLVVEADADRLKPQDLLVLTKSWPGEKMPKWWVPDRVKHLVSASVDKAPKSVGSQSVRLQLSEEFHPQINYHLDTIAEKAGKTLPVEGKWNLSFWAKGSEMGEKLRVSFKRIGRWDRKPSTFVDRLLSLSPGWKEYNLEFLGIDQGGVGPLQLHFEGVGQKGAVHIDDCYLGPINKGMFRQEVVAALKRLKPGFIRSAQGDIGENFANITAPLFARKACRFRPCRGSREVHFHYGLEELISLCHEVGARPWIQLPPYLTNEELDLLGDFLKGSKEIYVEIDVALLGDVRAKEVANRLKERVGNDLELVILTGNAISSFLVESLEAGLTPQETISLMYQNPLIKGGSFITQTNFATMQGDATAFERNRLVTSATAGLSLANHIVKSLIDGTKAVSVYKLAGYEVMATEPVKHLSRGMDIKLFGVVRDFSAGRFRPTGLAMALLNKGVGGDLYLVKPNNELASKLQDKIQIAAFIDQEKLSYVVSSSFDQELSIRLLPPKEISVTPPKKRMYLSYFDLFDSNEEDVRVKIKSEPLQMVGGEFAVTIPPYGLVVLAQ